MRSENWTALDDLGRAYSGNYTCNEEPDVLTCNPYYRVNSEDNCVIDTKDLEDFLENNGLDELPHPNDEKEFWDWIKQVNSMTMIDSEDLDEWLWDEWEAMIGNDTKHDTSSNDTDCEYLKLADLAEEDCEIDFEDLISGKLGEMPHPDDDDYWYFVSELSNAVR